MKKNNEKNNKFIFIFLGILILLGVFNIVELNLTKNALSNQIIIGVENSKPAQISLTIIDIDNKSNCPKCVDITKVVKLVSDSQKINITKFENKKLNDLDIQSKIKELGINKFPALIIEGNINQSSFLVKNIEKITNKINDNTYVFTPIESPYLNNNGQVIGKVNVIGLYDKTCTDCPDINLLVNGINSSPILVDRTSKVDINSLEGKLLVSKYNIDKVPTLLFSKELSGYSSITNNWEKGVGSIEDDQTYVLRTINPVYFSILENRVVGKINLTIISDKNCKNCFNGSEIFPAILGKLSIGSFDKNIVDTTSVEGVDLINKYKLEKFPTMIISGDTNSYPNLKQVWSQVGTIENNDYIFRNIELLKLPYFDINNGEITPKIN